MLSLTSRRSGRPDSFGGSAFFRFLKNPKGLLLAMSGTADIIPTSLTRTTRQRNNRTTGIQNGCNLQRRFRRRTGRECLQRLRIHSAGSLRVSQGVRGGDEGGRLRFEIGLNREFKMKTPAINGLEMDWINRVARRSLKSRPGRGKTAKSAINRRDRKTAKADCKI